jgi:heme A synthase
MIQKRPLGGGTGAPVAIAAGGTTVHTFDATTTANGGPYMDEVSLFVNNPTAGALNVTVVVLGGATIVFALAARTTGQIFTEQPFRLSGGTIICSEATAALVAWGWFTRS